MNEMGKEQAVSKHFALSRLYAIASVLGVLVAGIALAVLFRELSIRAILDFGEQSNVTVANTALNAFCPELAEYLRLEESAGGDQTTKVIPPRLLDLVRESVRGTAIARIKIYDRRGTVLYSTREYEIGTDDRVNEGFQSAIGGDIRSKLSYRDWFDVFQRADRDDNLIETYVPVRQVGQHQPVGVFEIYTDVAPIVRAMTRTELLVLLGIGLIMSILYGSLLYVVRRSERIIADQRQTILERTRTLELLSARMLAAEDAERHRIATELHEEIAQTLAAVKIRVEAYASAAAKSRSRSGKDPSEDIVLLVQAAIRDVRDLAMDLRPPSLEDFGLLTATRWLCRKTAEAHEDPAITTDFTVGEREIPREVKPVIYRILQETLRQVTRTAGIDELRIAITKQDEELTLAVDLAMPTAPPASEDDPFLAVWERAVLSGASVNRSRPAETGVRYEARWVT
jgi:signal transduction histidine kinase